MKISKYNIFVVILFSLATGAVASCPEFPFNQTTSAHQYRLAILCQMEEKNFPQVVALLEHGLRNKTLEQLPDIGMIIRKITESREGVAALKNSGIPLYQIIPSEAEYKVIAFLILRADREFFLDVYRHRPFFLQNSEYIRIYPSLGKKEILEFIKDFPGSVEEKNLFMSGYSRFYGDYPEARRYLELVTTKNFIYWKETFLLDMSQGRDGTSSMENLKAFGRDGYSFLISVYLEKGDFLRAEELIRKDMEFQVFLHEEMIRLYVIREKYEEAYQIFWDYYLQRKISAADAGRIHPWFAPLSPAVKGTILKRVHNKIRSGKQIGEDLTDYFYREYIMFSMAIGDTRTFREIFPHARLDGSRVREFIPMAEANPEKFFRVFLYYHFLKKHSFAQDEDGRKFLYFLYQSRYWKEFLLYSSLLEIEPRTDLDLYYHKAIVYYYLGIHDDAIKIFREIYPYQKSGDYLLLMDYLGVPEVFPDQKGKETILAASASSAYFQALESLKRNDSTSAVQNIKSYLEDPKDYGNNAVKILFFLNRLENSQDATTLIFRMIHFQENQCRRMPALAPEVVEKCPDENCLLLHYYPLLCEFRKNPSHPEWGKILRFYLSRPEVDYLHGEIREHLSGR